MQEFRMEYVTFMFWKIFFVLTFDWNIVLWRNNLWTIISTCQSLTFVFSCLLFSDCSWVYRKFKDHHRSKIDKDSQVCIWICQDSWEKEGHRNTQSKHHVSDCPQMKKCIVIFYTHSEILPRIKKNLPVHLERQFLYQLFTSFSIQWDLTVLFLLNERLILITEF